MSMTLADYLRMQEQERQRKLAQEREAMFASFERETRSLVGRERERSKKRR